MNKAISAGGIIFKKDQTNKIQICLVDYSGEYTGYGYPKGHVDTGETIEIGALREATEETGIEFAKTLKYLGSFTRKSKEWSGETVQKEIHLFLMDATNKQQTHEPDEKISWFDIDQVAQNLSFDEDRQFFIENLPKIKETINAIN